jgi:hypothetical protein
VRLSAFRDEIEKVEEFREADGGGFRSANESFALGTECGDTEGHGDAVIAA